MAAPLLLWPLLSAFASWLATFLVKLVDWIIHRWQLVKAGICCTIFLACFLMAMRAYAWVISKLDIAALDVTQQVQGLSHYGAGADGSFLSILNYALPISETFALTAAYISIFAGLIAFKGFLFFYRNIPFKST